MVLREKVYNTIKDRIVKGIYKPGEPLNEKKIIEELNVSRTPFREAINALSEENLIQIFANRGIFVREVTAKDISNIFDIRYQLEPYVCRLACKFMPGDTISELKNRLENALAGNSYQTLLEEDDFFHRCILKYTDNEELARIMRNLYEQNAMQKVVFDTKENYITRERQDAAILSIEEHLSILKCIENRDEAGAEAATRNHLQLAGSRTSSYK